MTPREEAKAALAEVRKQMAACAAGAKPKAYLVWEERGLLRLLDTLPKGK
jgi:hypothetical protein